MAIEILKYICYYNHMKFIKKKKDMSFFDNKDLASQNIEIILTQKCNMACAHCMRGDATNKEIKPEVLDALFSKFIYIHALTLGGGEISLTPYLVRLVTQKLKQYGTIVHRIDFTTNGLYVSDEFLDALSELRDYILSCENEINLVEPCAGENEEPLIVCFSFDDFHFEEVVKHGIEDVEDLLRNVGRYAQRFGEKAVECRVACDVDIINDGRAKNLKTFISKTKQMKPSDNLFPYLIHSNYIFFGGIPSISCDGYVIPVNIPYENEKALSFGNICNESISQIIARMNTKEVKSDEEYNHSMKKIIEKMIAPNYKWKRYLKVIGNKKFAYFDFMIKKYANNQPEK